MFLADFALSIDIFECAGYFIVDIGLGVAWVCGWDYSICVWAFCIEFAWVSFILNRQEYHHMGVTKLEENKLFIRLG